MYDRIKNPESGKWVSLFSKKGRNILKMYLTLLGGSYLKEEQNEKAPEITSEKHLQEILNNSDKTLVNFYAPWCGHCNNFSNSYDSIYQEMKNSKISVVKVNSDEQPGLISKYKVRGYPTLKIFKNKNDNLGEDLGEEYNNSRDIKTIVEELKKN